MTLGAGLAGMMDPPNTQPRDFGNESALNLVSQIELAPLIYMTHKTYDPAYNDLKLGELNQTLFGAGTTPGLLSDLTKAAPQLDQLNTFQRKNDVRDLMSLGPTALNALQKSDPLTARLMNNLTSQANDDLSKGTRLSPTDLEEGQQYWRGANQGRLTDTGDSGAAMESLYLGDRGRQLQTQRRGFATQVAGLRKSMYDVPGFLFNRGAGGSSAGMGLLSGANGSLGGNLQTINPESPYAGDVWNTDFNAKAARDIIKGNNRAAAVSNSGLGD